NEVTGDTGENWYQYVAGDNETDTRTSKWANAKTKDGSYWVWIPRYEYKILSGEGTSTAGKIDVKFIPTTQTTADEGYKIHPAFTDGTSNNYKNGEWDKELAGIWVAKYEMSMETNGIATETSSSSIGNVEISDTVKMVSKPNVSSWRNITIGNSYKNAFNYDRAKESHLMKNSEWGAVAYLTQSQYGRNGHEITINNSSSYITGNAGNSVSASQAAGTTNAYNTEKGVLASTTGNIYGIYDLSGGAYEMTANYISNGDESLSTYGGTMVAKTIADAEGYQTLSTKYVTVYPYNLIDSCDNNYTTYKNLGYGYGDAILETSSSGVNFTSWHGDSSFFLYTSNPFVVRGNNYSATSKAGSFSFNISNGNFNVDSFRAVLVGV
ncbi:MAG: formylglycine-generating enzyme family protein, partial [Clostridia bacterium]|nr:formylglycine-generating enzyme family protein [Clostridia bacterium]